ncbi:MAG: hypothetical protein ABSD38_20555 [Syntrophorhabdales bacterium]
MSAHYDRIDEMDKKIRLLRSTAEELMAMAGDIEAIKKNLVRLLASTRMLELNVSDVKEVL